MPKIASINSKKIIKILELSGFQIDHSTGSHFILYNSENKRRAVVPYHKRDLPKGTIMSILREAGLTKKDLEKLL